MKKLTLIVLLIIIKGYTLDKANVFSIKNFDKETIRYNYISGIYHSLQNCDHIPCNNAFYYGMNGYLELIDKGVIFNERYLSIIDYSLSSKEKRFWVIDIHNKDIIYNTLVAHGKNSGVDIAKSFSNRPKSNKSSIGFFITDSIYTGKHGLSLRLDGIEKGINDNARKRAIVMHPATYVSEEFIVKNGRLGRSFGCPALPVKISDEIINTIQGKSLLYIYYNDKEYLNQSLLSHNVPLWFN